MLLSPLKRRFTVAPKTTSLLLLKREKYQNFHCIKISLCVL
ncbi:unnamed protein product [Brassica rapa]|uniref:Uncharacterized protein n=1 Tax=Brassica campestris TaxID=3711 RepID=A0A3P6D9V4_BRACM|nr:unnamed protein product [Brassica rapa]VDD16059.1 unnamed protein product [Brassica rapa]